MKDEIIAASIESLRSEGLRFSVDTLANRMKISKKTIYRYFPDKEALALAIYERYYDDAEQRAKALAQSDSQDDRTELLRLYYDSKMLTRGEIFNKYKLNRSISSYTEKRSERLWDIILSASDAGKAADGENSAALRIIVDGSLEKLCGCDIAPDAVIERLVKLLWS